MSAKIQRQLALSGKLNLAPAYVVMAFNCVTSYVSAMVHNRIDGSKFVSAVREFGLHHISSVRSVASLSKDANLCAFVATLQWMLTPLYVLTFCLFLWPFSKVAKVAMDNAMHQVTSEREENRAALGRIVFFSLFPFVLMGDLGILPVPTFLNGGLFTSRNGEPLMAYVINSSLQMPAFLWVIVFGTFMFYWVFIHLAANYRTILNL